MQLDPSHIMQVGMGFWGSRALLSAVELELFTRLGEGEGMTADQIREALALSERAVPDFPDTLVALKMLERDGNGAEATYRNTAETAKFIPHGVSRDTKDARCAAEIVVRVLEDSLYDLEFDIIEIGAPVPEVHRNRLTR